MKTTLYLARHGETQWNKIKRFQGQLDSDLTALGKEQSKRIAKSLVDKKIKIIFSSHLGRAISTANICNKILNANTQIQLKLTERHLGNWQGQQITTLSQHVNYNELLHKYTNLTPEGGESAITCGQRIYNALEEIAQHYKECNILVIFHGEALRCFYALLGNNSSMNAYDLFKNGCITKLTYEHSNASFHIST